MDHIYLPKLDRKQDEESKCHILYLFEIWTPRVFITNLAFCVLILFWNFKAMFIIETDIVNSNRSRNKLCAQNIEFGHLSAMVS